MLLMGVVLLIFKNKANVSEGVVAAKKVLKMLITRISIGTGYMGYMARPKIVICPVLLRGFVAEGLNLSHKVTRSLKVLKLKFEKPTLRNIRI